MASKKFSAALRKALTRAENEEKRNRLNLALLKVQEIKGCGKDPNFSELTEGFNGSCSTLGRHFNCCISKLEDSIKHWLLPVEVEDTQLKSNEMFTKFAGGKPLLRWFIEVSDPKILLEDLQNPNGAFSPAAPCQARRQCCKTIIYNGDDGE